MNARSQDSRPKRPIRARRRGANAVEFALLLPALVGLLFGVLEFSWMFNRFLMLSTATQSTARLAAMTPQDEDPEAAARAHLDTILEPSVADAAQLEVVVTGAAPTRTIQITVTVPYASLTGYIPGIPDSLTSTTSLRMEDQL